MKVNGLWNTAPEEVSTKFQMMGRKQQSQEILHDLNIHAAFEVCNADIGNRHELKKFQQYLF